MSSWAFFDQINIYPITTKENNRMYKYILMAICMLMLIGCASKDKDKRVYNERKSLNVK